ncbi:MAG: DUF4177 domain-containing protein [Anaerolineae bacterium]
MPDRKETPDILGQILGNVATPDQPVTPIGSVVPVAPRTAPRKSPAKRESGPKWEYLTVTFQETTGWHARFADGEELDKWEKGLDLPEMLDALGEAGWELINVTTRDHLFGRSDQLQAFFKRVKA